MRGGNNVDVRRSTRVARKPNASGHRLSRGPSALHRACAQTRIRAPASISHPLDSSPPCAERRRARRRQRDARVGRNARERSPRAQTIARTIARPRGPLKSSCTRAICRARPRRLQNRQGGAAPRLEGSIPSPLRGLDFAAHGGFPEARAILTRRRAYGPRSFAVALVASWDHRADHRAEVGLGCLACRLDFTTVISYCGGRRNWAGSPVIAGDFGAFPPHQNRFRIEPDCAHAVDPVVARSALDVVATRGHWES